MSSLGKNAILGRLTLRVWLTRQEIDAVAAAALRRPSLIGVLAELLFHDEPFVQGKAARVLAAVAAQQPPRLQPYKELLIQEVAGCEHWLGRESFCRVITKLRLTADDVRQVVEVLLGYLDDDHGAVRAQAMQALVEVTQGEPVLREEILPVIELLTQTGTPAMRARGRNLLKKLYKVGKRNT